MAAGTKETLRNLIFITGNLSWRCEGNRSNSVWRGWYWLFGTFPWTQWKKVQRESDCGFWLDYIIMWQQILHHPNCCCCKELRNSIVSFLFFQGLSSAVIVLWRAPEVEQTHGLRPGWRGGLGMIQTNSGAVRFWWEHNLTSVRTNCRKHCVFLD